MIYPFKLTLSYRLPFDLFEEYCISMADKVVVNSLYTQSVYKNSFRFLIFFGKPLPTVIYPCVDFQTIRSLAVYSLPVAFSHIGTILQFHQNWRNASISFQ